MRRHLRRAAVAVLMSGRAEVISGVGRHTGAGRGRRARDVRDRRDVVPVDAVADAQQQTGDEHPDPDGTGVDLRDEVEHRSLSSRVELEC